MIKRFLVLIFIVFLFSCDSNLKGLTLYVVDSVGGGSVEGVSVYIQPNPVGGVVDSALSLEPVKSDSRGVFYREEIGLGLYSILLRKEGYGDSLLQDYYLTSDAEVLELIIMPLGVKDGTSHPLLFSNIAASGNENAGWKFAPTLSESGKIKFYPELKSTSTVNVKVMGAYPIMQTSEGSFGIGMMINGVPSGFGSYRSATDINSSTVQLGNGQWEASAQYLMASLLPNVSPFEAHFICFVAYDSANNRVEKRIPFTTSEENIMETKHLKTPIITKYEMKTFAVNREIYSLGATTPPRKTTGYMVFTIKGALSSGSAPFPYDGFEIWRANSSSLVYHLVQTHQLAPNGQLAEYEFLDSSSQLQVGEKYRYKVRAFSGKYYSDYVKSPLIVMLPSFTMEMVSPTGGDFYFQEEFFQVKVNNYDELTELGVEAFTFSLRIQSMDGTEHFTYPKGGNEYIPLFIWDSKMQDFYLYYGSSSDDLVQLPSSAIQFDSSTALLKIDMYEVLGLRALRVMSFSFLPDVPYLWYIDGGVHGPEASLLEIIGESTVKSTSIASAAEHVGAVETGNSYTFTAREGVR